MFKGKLYKLYRAIIMNVRKRYSQTNRRKNRQMIADIICSKLSYGDKFHQMKAIKSHPWDSIHTEAYLFCSLSAANTLTFRPQPSATTRMTVQILCNQKQLTFNFQHLSMPLDFNIILQDILKLSCLFRILFQGI